MDIRRIDESTIRIILTEAELLERGIEKKEIWQNKDKGEMLFIDMMEEAYEKERFAADGPLWIEAHMYDYGVEIFVTKGEKRNSLNLKGTGYKDIAALESRDKGGDHNSMNHEMFSSKLQSKSPSTDSRTHIQNTVYYSSVYKFYDVEYIIQLAQRLPLPFFDSKLISYNGHYYLVVQYPESKWIRSKDMVESLILEYGERAHVSVYRLEEYGKIIISENAIVTMKKYFTNDM